jgi:hypothetical protein
MANAVYPKAREQGMGAGLDLLNADVRAVLVELPVYVYSDTHEFLSSVAAGARVAVTDSLSGKSVTNGVFDADDISIASVSGDVVAAIVVYSHTGNEATSRLLCYIDSGVGFPFTPNGGQLTITWNASGIFAL